MVILVTVATTEALQTFELLGQDGRLGGNDTSFQPVIPKVWDEEALASLELPLADGKVKAEHASADYYYNLPVRPIYRQYPVYVPEREPADYFEELRSKEPEIAFDSSRLHTKQDWLDAGRLVFSAPVAYIPLPPYLRDKKAHDEFRRLTEQPVAANGVTPFIHYVVREKGKVELGIASCADCHTRVMPDGTVILGAQGNQPIDRILANIIRITLDLDPKEDAAVRRAHMADYGAPWIKDSRNNEVLETSAVNLARWHRAIPAGVMSRQGSSLFWPVQVPDLIGIKDRRYLDKTGLVRHRTIGDIMRYAALNQGMDYLTKYDNFIPVGKNFRDMPAPEELSESPHFFSPLSGERYSDEQLYALALFLYSLEPPPNPNKFDGLARRGKKVFESEDCGRCHTPPHYTSNRLTPVDGFDVPENHYDRFDIEDEVVGTDPHSALKTRRGTGYYKIPSLKGLWYRGPLEHNGSVASLEDWFDSNRLSPNYAPTGWKPLDVKNRAVPGHEYGLDLSPDDKAALIAFLKTL